MHEIASWFQPISEELAHRLNARNNIKNTKYAVRDPFDYGKILQTVSRNSRVNFFESEVVSFAIRNIEWFIAFMYGLHVRLLTKFKFKS